MLFCKETDACEAYQSLFWLHGVESVLFLMGALCKSIWAQKRPSQKSGGLSFMSVYNHP